MSSVGFWGTFVWFHLYFWSNHLSQRKTRQGHFTACFFFQLDWSNFQSTLHLQENIPTYLLHFHMGTVTKLDLMEFLSGNAMWPLNLCSLETYTTQPQQRPSCAFLCCTENCSMLRAWAETNPTQQTCPCLSFGVASWGYYCGQKRRTDIKTLLHPPIAWLLMMTHCWAGVVWNYIAIKFQNWTVSFGLLGADENK